MLIAFDRFIHGWIFNPVVRLIQAWFHVNRYHLLFVSEAAAAALYALIGCYLLVAGVLKFDPFYLGCGLLYAFVVTDWVRTGRVAQRLNAMKEAYERFEDRGFARPAATLVVLAADRKSSRPLMNLITVVFLIGDGVLWWRGISLGWFNGVMTVFFVTTWVNAHLWDVDDLDPRDREFLFGPQGQTDSSPG